MEEAKPQLQSNIQAQYQPMYAGQMQQPYNMQQQTYPQGAFVQGVPVGYPIQQQQPLYQQQPMQQMYGQPQMMYQQQPYMGQHTPGQQIVVMQILGPAGEKIIIEERIRNAARWFNGCNSVWMIFIFFNLLVRSITLFATDNGAAKAAGVIIIIEDIIWILTIIVGVYGMSKFYENYLLYYQYGLGVVMLLEAISSIIIFATLTDEEGNRAIFVIFFILTLLCLASFMHNARQLRQAIKIWKSIQVVDPSQQQQQNQIQI